jgi:hypothetical protein
MQNIFENPAEFQNEIAQILQAIKERGDAEAKPMVQEFMRKYNIPATITKGSECGGCSTCVGCAYCGFSPLAATMHVGHSMYVWAWQE